jgi:hypothetical protein
MTTNYTFIIVPFCVCLFVVEKTTMNTLTHLHLLFFLFFLQQILTTMSWALIVFLFSLYVCHYRKDDDKHNSSSSSHFFVTFCLQQTRMRRSWVLVIILSSLSIYPSAKKMTTNTQLVVVFFLGSIRCQHVATCQVSKK